jgi:hypothetical protein
MNSRKLYGVFGYFFILFLLFSPSKAQVFQFDPVSSLSVGTSPRGIAVGSLFENGIQNLVVANFGSPTFIGQSSPTSLLNTPTSNIQIFSPSSNGLQLTATIPTGQSPRGISLFGLNGQNKETIFVTAYDSNLLQVFNFVGGQWQKTDEAPTLKMPVGVATGLTGPGGIPFVVTADYGSNSLSIFPIVAGKMGKRIDIPVDQGPTQVAIGNLIGNGSNQIAVVCLPSSKIDILSFDTKSEGTDLASVSVVQTISMPPGSAPADLRITDLNNDGLMDLIVADFSNNSIDIYLQQKNGSLLPQSVLKTSGDHPNGLTVADLDGSGNKEIIVANRDSDSIDIFQPKTGGYQLIQTLKTSSDIDSSFGPVEIGVLDSRQIGGKDLVVTHMRSNTLKILTQSLTAISTPTPTQAASENGRPSFSENTTFCYPNPSRDGNVKFCFNLDSPSSVLIQVFDLNGEKVWSQQVGGGQTQIGTNVIPWSGTNQAGQNLASGLYIYRITAGNQSVTKKMAILH